MSRFGVTAAKEADLLARMARLDLHEEDLDERFVTSGGPGGQKVNRSNTCVQLTHGPSGIEVKMQRARSQALNRFLARRRLCELLEERLLGRESPEGKRRDQARKQKARRLRRARKKAAAGDPPRRSGGSEGK